jgi:hypothetical protein
MSKTISSADDHAAQLARMHDLCSMLDDVREESERICSDVTAEARRMKDAAQKVVARPKKRGDAAERIVRSSEQRAAHRDT